jgi:TIR domain
VRVFISFSSRDREAVRQLEAALRLRRPDISCFLDERGLTGGTYWIPRLARELADADVILLLLGETVGRWQELEYYESLQLSRQAARDGRPRIIPVMIADRPAQGKASEAATFQCLV